MDVGQSEIAAGVAVGETFVIEAHQVEHRCVQIVKMRLFNADCRGFAGPSLNLTIQKVCVSEQKVLIAD